MRDAPRFGLLHSRGIWSSTDALLQHPVYCDVLTCCSRAAADKPGAAAHAQTGLSIAGDQRCDHKPTHSALTCVTKAAQLLRCSTRGHPSPACSTRLWFRPVAGATLHRPWNARAPELPCLISQRSFLQSRAVRSSPRGTSVNPAQGGTGRQILQHVRGCCRQRARQYWRSCTEFTTRDSEASADMSSAARTAVHARLQ